MSADVIKFPDKKSENKVIDSLLRSTTISAAQLVELGYFTANGTNEASLTERYYNNTPEGGCEIDPDAVIADARVTIVHPYYLMQAAEVVQDPALKAELMTQVVSRECVEKISQFDLPMKATEKQHLQDMVFMEEAIRACVHRYLGLPHRFHAMIEEKVKFVNGKYSEDTGEAR